MPDNNKHLSDLFRNDPAFQEAEHFAKITGKDVLQEGTSTVQLELPTAFLSMVRFLEEQRAEQAGVSPSSLEQCLQSRLLNQLHEELHWLTVDPRRFPYYRDLWNRLCDQEGMPEQRLSTPGTPGPDEPF